MGSASSIVMNTSPKIPPGPLKDRVSAEEWNTRVELAACYRLVSLYGMTDMIANHISAMVPGEPNHYLINPYGMLYEEITASSLIKIDIDGKSPRLYFCFTPHDHTTKYFETDSWGPQIV